MASSVVLPAGIRFFERGWLSSNNVLLTGEGESALVDTGYVTHAGQTLALLDAALGGAPLDLLLNTHLHSDHCGGNAALQARYPSLRTLIPPGQAEAVRRWDPVALTYEPTGQSCPRFRLDGLLRPGDEMPIAGRRWQVLASPGHDPDSVVLFEPEHGVLISADSLWENGFGVVFPELEGDSAFDVVARTLDLIDGLRPRIVLPGHGAAFGGEGVAEALRRARSRLDSFVRDPRRHAAHAAKVLLKFKLLELQDVREGELLDWAAATVHFQNVHRRYFAGETEGEWLRTLVASLEGSGALVRNGDRLLNS